MFSAFGHTGVGRIVRSFSYGACVGAGEYNEKAAPGAPGRSLKSVRLKSVANC